MKPSLTESLNFKARLMKTAGGQIPVLWLCIGVIAMQFSGCTVGTKSFSMDSVSRMPFFGLELWERKPKSSGPAFREIRGTVSDKLHFETASVVGKTTGKKRESTIAQVDRTETAVTKPIEPPAKVVTRVRTLAFSPDNKHGSNPSRSESDGIVDFN